MSDSLDAFNRDLARWPVWSVEEEREAGARLVAARAEGDSRAIRREVDRFVRHNLRLTLAMVGRFRSAAVPLEDLIQEGNIGLIRAAEKFEPERGHRFSTYATWWIRQAIGRALGNDGATIRTPGYVGDDVRSVRRARARVLAATGRQATHDELREMTGIASDAIHRADEVPAPPLPLDAPMGEGVATYLDMMPGSVASPEDLAIAKERAIEARRLLDRLDPRSRDMMQSRFGDDEPTLHEVGVPWGVTRERVRQIEIQSLAELRQVVQRDAARARNRRGPRGGQVPGPP